ncbi:DUF4230 domain-containing protein [Paralysiella testudinis]|uniref:DUF4230 domain-containing protein n=1 Tax=Paralysiella testudinis TaxID=2809020 RepID=A0A892ZL81_9NEIS|nr:DUF4230 domain-containing protein [Paralysiella testudinis]QRQ82304.1 DUF4230 domain-containing protein [Paralysiella testudinis]
MKKLILWLLPLSLLAVAAWWWLNTQRTPAAQQVMSREAVITQIQSLNRLETTAFQIDSIIRTQQPGHWYNLWQDSQKGLFLVHGSVVAGVDLAQLRPENVHTAADGRIHIELPPVSVFQVNLDNIEVYDLKTGTLGLHPVDTSVFATVQTEARAQILASACRAQILTLANEQAQKHITALFALANQPVNVVPAAVPACNANPKK